MDIPLKIERRDIGLKLLGSESSLVLGNGITWLPSKREESCFVQCISCRHESKIPQRKEEQVSAEMS